MTFFGRYFAKHSINYGGLDFEYLYCKAESSVLIRLLLQRLLMNKSPLALEINECSRLHPI
jgi:hypothetical protein